MGHAIFLIYWRMYLTDGYGSHGIQQQYLRFFPVTVCRRGTLITDCKPHYTSATVRRKISEKVSTRRRLILIFLLLLISMCTLLFKSLTFLLIHSRTLRRIQIHSYRYTCNILISFNVNRIL